MITWDAIWKQRTSEIITQTVPMFRIILHLILTSHTNDCFYPINFESGLYVIRRKPSINRGKRIQTRDNITNFLEWIKFW